MPDCPAARCQVALYQPDRITMPTPFPPQDDIDKIMAIMADAFDPAYGEAWTRGQVESALLMPGCEYCLIGADGQTPGDEGPAIGFAMLRHVLDEAELLLFAVSRPYRKQGIGSRLLRDVLIGARARGTTRMVLEMRQGNPAAHLYRAHGFTQIGSRPKYYKQPSGERIDAITMAADLI